MANLVAEWDGQEASRVERIALLQSREGERAPTKLVVPADRNRRKQIMQRQGGALLFVAQRRRDPGAWLRSCVLSNSGMCMPRRRALAIREQRSRPGATRTASCRPGGLSRLLPWTDSGLTTVSLRKAGLRSVVDQPL
jgi:hypothetical protein